MSIHGFDFVGKKHINKKQYFGKYRAIVTKIDDPLMQGRIKFKCPKVLGDYESNWAMPCVPYGYFTLPMPGTLIWVEFEEGDPDQPIWTGMWVPQGKFLVTGKDKKSHIIITTENGNLTINSKQQLRISSEKMDITLETPNGNIHLNP